MTEFKTVPAWTRFLGPILYIFGWYSNSQLESIRRSVTGEGSGSSRPIAYFIVLITVSAYFLWKSMKHSQDSGPTKA
jgi:hypothetical protein